MTPSERKDILRSRQRQRLAWHEPPHFFGEGNGQYLVTSACFDHSPIVGKSTGRMAQCEEDLISICEGLLNHLHAWCILPNHYHLLVRTDSIEKLLHALGRWHGRTARQWNIEDDRRGRKVWFRSVERLMQSDRHFFATLNYVHHNPVKHGYARKWQDWPFGSAKQFLEKVGRESGEEIWRNYPIRNYGASWDV